MAIDGEYDPELYGVHQIENFDFRTLSIFTSLTDKACLRDLLKCNCICEAAEIAVQEFLYKLA